MTATDAFLWYCIKFCQKLGNNQVETIQKIQTAFGDNAMGITQVKEWYNRFKDGCTTVESEPRFGRPSTGRHDQVIAKVNTGDAGPSCDYQRNYGRGRRFLIKASARHMAMKRERNIKQERTIWLQRQPS